MGILAQAIAPLPFTGREKALKAIAELVAEREVGEIVMGHPLNMDGSRGEMAEFSERLAEDLRARTNLPVHLWDERLSSAEVERLLIHGEVRRENRKKVRDGLAAVLILQGFLDRRSSTFSA